MNNLLNFAGEHPVLSVLFSLIVLYAFGEILRFIIILIRGRPTIEEKVAEKLLEKLEDDND